MEALINIATFVALVCFILICFKAFSMFSKLNNFISDTNHLLKEIKPEITTVVSETKNTLNKVNDFIPIAKEKLDQIDEIKEEMMKKSAEITEVKKSTQVTMQSIYETSDTYNKLGESISHKIEKLDKIIDKFSDLADKAYDNINEPITETSRVVGAVYKGFKAFKDKIM